MSLDRCIDETAKGLGLDRKDVEEIVARLKAEKARLGAERADEGLRKFAKGAAEEARIAAALKRKQAALTILKRDAADRHIDAQLAKGVPLKEAMLAYLVGGVHDRDSVAARRGALEAKWVSGLTDRLAKEAPVALEMLKRPEKETRAFFDDVVREMAELKKDGKPGSTKNKDAQKVAAVVANHAEAVRLELNKLGANIGRIDGWTGPQRWHETLLLRAGPEAWVDKVVKAIDIERSFGPGTTEERARDILHGVWHNLVTGEDLKDNAASAGDRVGPSNVANGMAKHRVLHFKSADDWLAVNAEFGRGHLLDGLTDMMHAAARKASLMDKLGPNPEAMWHAIIDDRQKRQNRLSRAGKLDPTVARDTAKEIAPDGVLGRAYAEVSGSANIPSSPGQASFERNARALTVMSKLAGSFLSQFPDLATYASGMRDQGKSIWQGLFDAFHGLAAGGDKEVARIYHVGADAFNASVHERFAIDGLGHGLMARGAEATYKLGLTKWWSERLETSYATMTSHWMATQAEHAFGDLDTRYRYLLGLHGIGEKEWQAIRGAVGEVNGVAHVLPERIADRETGLKVRQFVAEEVAHAITKGDDRTRLLLHQGQRPGTPVGTAIRLMTQFLSFPIAFQQKMLGRALYSYPGADPSLRGIKGFGLAVAGAARHNTGALASIIAGTTMMGMLSMWAKDVARNRTPKSPAMPATWMAAMMQGGGLGIYGDFMFGQADRNGGALQSKLAGPAAGSAGDLLDLAMKARDEFFGTGQQKVRASDFVNLGLANTPFVNLWYARAALDIAVLNGLQEWASPGTFGKRAGAIKQQFGQRYIVSPLGHSPLWRQHSSPRGALE